MTDELLDRYRATAPFTATNAVFARRGNEIWIIAASCDHAPMAARIDNLGPDEEPAWTSSPPAVMADRAGH